MGKKEFKELGTFVERDVGGTLGLAETRQDKNAREKEEAAIEGENVRLGKLEADEQAKLDRRKNAMLRARQGRASLINKKVL